MKQLISALAAALAALFAPAGQAAAQPSSWDRVARVVAIGDLEGDYDKFADMLRSAGLVNAAGNWIGGDTHLVQLGDVPDRGPNSRMIMDHLRRLEPQARRAGGRVHALIGNHEAMNIEGDLRYTHPGEFAAFADASSQRRRDSYYRQVLRQLQANPPADGAPIGDELFRIRWEAEHPLGWVEHRRAWAPNGRYGRWVSAHNSAIRINDTLYLHGGLGPSFLSADRDAINRAVRAALRGSPLAAYPDIQENQQGPLWHRGLALNAEASEREHVDALLARHGVARIVVGHTKLAPAVIPRFGGRVLVADIARTESDPHAFLILEGATVTAVHRGQRVVIEADTPAGLCAYLTRISELDAGAGAMAERASNACASAAQP